MAGKKTGKRLLTWVLVLVMALSLLPLNALAKDVCSAKYDWIRIYLDDATNSDLKALDGLSHQVRIVIKKYPGGMHACAPVSDYWWTENNFYKVTANNIKSIDLAGDEDIGSSNKISIPIQGNETYKVTVSEGYHEGITSLDSYYYLRIDISKRTPEPPKAPDAPNYDNLKTLIGDITVNCTNTEATHSDKSKTYALIEDSYTTSEVAGDAENGYTCTVTINSQKYVEQFDSDTGATHTPKDATATVTLEYKNSAWLVKSGTPISFNVVCDAAPMYPVYVYAFFAHDNAPLRGDVTVNGKPIEWNEDANNEEYKEYFVTLGVYPNGTTKEPTNGNTGLDLEALKGKKYELFDGTGSGKANGVTLTDITSYPSPSGKVCKGAAGYPEIGEKLSWHLDGQVNVYTVTYDNNDGTAQGAPTSNDYYFGSYTIAAAPKRDGYTFTGWKDGNTTYPADKEITLEKDLKLVAQWTACTDLSYTVNHLWGNESIGSTTGEAEYGYTITPSTSFDGYTLISGQTTTYTITEDGRVFNLYYYKNVTLTANSDTKTYDGTEHTVTGYTAKDNKDNLVEGLTFTGVASPSVSALTSVSMTSSLAGVLSARTMSCISSPPSTPAS